jgi:hypothetical protein
VNILGWYRGLQGLLHGTIRVNTKELLTIANYEHGNIISEIQLWTGDANPEL